MTCCQNPSGCVLKQGASSRSRLGCRGLLKCLQLSDCSRLWNHIASSVSSTSILCWTMAQWSSRILYCLCVPPTILTFSWSPTQGAPGFACCLRCGTSDGCHGVIGPTRIPCHAPHRHHAWEKTWKWLKLLDLQDRSANTKYDQFGQLGLILEP